MKKKILVVSLLAAGIVLLLASIVFTISAASSKNIIGGADWPTLCFVFYNEKRGLYSTLAFLGVCSIIASIIVGVKKKK